MIHVIAQVKLIFAQNTHQPRTRETKEEEKINKPDLRQIPEKKTDLLRALSRKAPLGKPNRVPNYSI